MTSPIPEIIYLQWHGDQDPECLTRQELERKPSLDEVSWCWEQIFEYDIKYIRKETYDQLRSNYDILQERIEQTERRMQDAVDALNADTAQELSFKHAAREAERNRDDMKEKWDYYQAFVKAQGANSITDLASRHNKMLTLLEQIHIEAYGGELSSDTWDAVDSLVTMYAKPKEVGL